MLLMSLSAMATNKIYVTQAGASLVFDVLQDGNGNMIGNSTTASTAIGSATNFNIDQVGDSNIITFDIHGDSFTGVWSTTGNSNNIDFNCDSADATSGCDSVNAVITFAGNSQDIDIVKALRAKTNAVFRIDANCAWETDETISNAQKLKDLGVEFIEQPLAADRWEDMKKVFDTSCLPLIADESCLVPEDVAKCVGHFHGINIKLTKCGGISPALGMIKEAKALGLKVMIGCMTESSVGISAIGQLLPQLDYVDMDGALLLKKDIAKGIVIHEDASLSYPDMGGSGIELLDL